MTFYSPYRALCFTVHRLFDSSWHCFKDSVFRTVNDVYPVDDSGVPHPNMPSFTPPFLLMHARTRYNNVHILTRVHMNLRALIAHNCRYDNRSMNFSVDCAGGVHIDFKKLRLQQAKGAQTSRVMIWGHVAAISISAKIPSSAHRENM